MVTKVKRRKPAEPERAVRVAVVGGGCAGLAVAWQLSKLPGYQVDVYEQSWRLGGKGASGRDSLGRVREHGLHIWLGCYENAFRMMRECYAKVQENGWGPGAQEGKRLAHGSFEQAFFPEPHIGVAVSDHADRADADSARRWLMWSGQLPPAVGMPGDPMDDANNPFTLSNYLVRCVELLRTLMLSAIARPGETVAEEPSKTDSRSDLEHGFDAARSPSELVEWATRMLRRGAQTAASVMYQAAKVLKQLLEYLDSSPFRSSQALLLMQAVVTQARLLLRDVVALDRKMGWKNEVINLVMTITIGLYQDRVLFSRRGFDAINGSDYRDWLEKHGATPEVLASPFLTAFYDLTFAYEGGNKRQPKLAAGVALRGALRMFFTYRGAMFWRMRSGMGDAVFAPLYRTLLAGERPVRFHFLHTLREVKFQFNKDERFVTQMVFDTAGDPALLSPDRAAALDAFGCWPDSPRLFEDVTRDGARELKLHAGEKADFDVVVFATGIDDFSAAVAGSGFFQEMPWWEEMRKQVHTVATQAAQVWMTKSLERLGWRRGSGIFTGFDAPFETWADMTPTLATESAWRQALGKAGSEADGARSLAYFCGVIADQDAPPVPDVADRAACDAAQTQADIDVKARLDTLLGRDIATVWPAAFEQGEEDAPTTALQGAVGDPHVQANFQRSDRYTLSLPGTIDARISPLERSVLNMVVAGDWTANGMDAGCVEAAVMSGMLAAHAITCEHPKLDAIVGYHHP